MASQPGYSASACAMSRTPSSKYSRLALTVPTMTLLPRTNSKLIRSAGTWIILSPPVTLESTSTPFLPRACMLSKTTPELPVASKIKSNGPNFCPPSTIGTSWVIRYRAPSASINSAFRLGLRLRANVVTSRPRRRNTIVASKPMVPAPMTAALRGCHTLRRRWISYAW